MELTISSWMDGPYTVVRVDGPLSNATAHALRIRLSDLLDYKRRRFILDLTTVDFSDFTGVLALVLFALEIRRLKGTLRLVAAQGPARGFIERTGLARFYPALDSVDDAKKAGVSQ